MAFEQRDNSGALFKNQDKSGQQPDYTGPLMVEGVEGRLAAWIKRDRNGKSYMSLSWQRDEEHQQRAPADEGPQGPAPGYGEQAPPDDDLDDSIPF